MRINITNSDDIGYTLYNSKASLLVRGISRAADFCVKSKMFNLLTLGYVHTFIHELGHAISYQLLTGGEATINLSTRNCYGSTSYKEGPRSTSAAENTWIDLSGCLADIVFSAIIIIGIFALTYFVSMPQNWSIALRVIVCVPCAFWIIGELLYAAISGYQVDEGDFGKIASRGWLHLLLAFTLLLGVCAATIFGVVFLY